MSCVYETKNTFHKTLFPVPSVSGPPCHNTHRIALCPKFEIVGGRLTANAFKLLAYGLVVGLPVPYLVQSQHEALRLVWPATCAIEIRL
jgi:hypothetical protein